MKDKLVVSYKHYVQRHITAHAHYSRACMLAYLLLLSLCIQLNFTYILLL
jgi:hypothetical protein